MIRSFRGTETAQLFLGRTAGLSPRFARLARRKLLHVNAAHRLADLAGCPGNRLRALEGADIGPQSLRVDTRCWLRFVWREGDAFEVEMRGRRPRAPSGRSRPLPPVHPGEVLREDLLAPLGLAVARVARLLKMPPARLRAIAAERRAVTVEAALRLGRHFGTTPQFWMNLQAAYDLEVAIRTIADRIAREVPPLAGRQA